MTRDGGYRASVAAASGHHLPHSAYLDWDHDDRQAEEELQAYDAERCRECGVHPDQFSPKYGADPRRPKTVPKWKFCPTCFLWEKAKDNCPEKTRDGAPAPGWHLTFVSASDERTSQEHAG